MTEESKASSSADKELQEIQVEQGKMQLMIINNYLSKKGSPVEKRKQEMDAEISKYLRTIKDLAKQRLGEIPSSLLIDEFFNLN